MGEIMSTLAIIVAAGAAVVGYCLGGIR